MDGVEASLRRLQTDHIDLYQIHGNDSVTPLEETIRALDTLVQQGKVRYIGCSNWQAWKIAKARGISEFKDLARFDTLQAYYSIAGRDIEREIVPLLESEKMGLFPASSAGRTRTLRIRAALNTTFPLWTNSGPGISSTWWRRLRKHTVVVLHVSRSHGSWQSAW